MIQKAGYSNPHTKTSTPSNDNICKLKWDNIFIPSQKNVWYLLLTSCLWKRHYLANISLILEEPIFQIFYVMNLKGCLINYLIIFLDHITAWWNLCFIKKWCMKNQRDAHLKSINPFPKFLARGRKNISLIITYMKLRSWPVEEKRKARQSQLHFESKYLLF